MTWRRAHTKKTEDGPSAFDERIANVMFSFVKHECIPHLCDPSKTGTKYYSCKRLVQPSARAACGARVLSRRVDCEPPSPYSSHFFILTFSSNQSPFA